jgi:cysteinyl-tRNA synthetase
MKYLGETMDIHGGGLDLIFPHHENEIAQSESYTGKTFARYWIHNGFVMVNKEKMSKSLGNFFTVKDILKEFKPDVLRLFLLLTHYRSPIDFSFEKLKDAQRGLQRILNFIGSIEIVKELPEREGEGESLDVDAYRREFEISMDDDFNTAKAIGILFELLKKANSIKDRAIKENKISKAEKLQVIEAIETVENLLRTLGFKLELELETGIEDELIKLLIDVRSELRKRRAFDLADIIRDRLNRMGIALEDLPSGTVYRKISRG